MSLILLDSEFDIIRARSYSWNIQEEVDSIRSYSWYILDGVQKALEYSWVINVFIEKALAYSWKIPQAVQMSLAYSWKVFDRWGRVMMTFLAPRRAKQIDSTGHDKDRYEIKNKWRG